jgi:hypothetical protein
LQRKKHIWNSYRFWDIFKSSTLADSNIVEGQIVEGCETSTIRWASGESDGHGGMVLKFHHATLVTCDDGFAAIVD